MPYATLRLPPKIGYPIVFGPDRGSDVYAGHENCRV